MSCQLSLEMNAEKRVRVTIGMHTWRTIAEIVKFNSQ
jgi:hypothetical protein